jgi:thiamine-phosphate pyrophosphorylase
MQKNVYRIIDADFNRAREALRVIEDFCRFVLDSKHLFERIRRIRHELSKSIKQLDAGLLISSRDTLGDVGIGGKTDKELGRNHLKDCLTAAFKRLPEALRVLAEVIVTLNPTIAQKVEQLRYTVYTLEKDVMLFSNAIEKFKNVRLYVIISSDLPAEILSLTSACASAGADALQLRTKRIDDATNLAVAVEFVKICKDFDVLSIINDRIDIAVVSGADGVHLGRSDLPIESAHKLSSYPLIVGRTTHSIEEIKFVIEQLPTYVSIGPVFPSPTKPDIKPVGLDYVKDALETLEGTGVGHVAIGGITLGNVEQLVAAGARAVAVCSAVANADNPALACRMLREKVACCGADDK